ncbi:MerR family transcriptional regulator [Roseateles sp.]|uniref:MerR family transcriptional regulator n=1 Tax=Roseateles sp. TaxID=1971397 RepID=UPI003BA44FA0
MEIALPAIPAKRYFTIGEVSDLCGVKPYVLRYWEQEFTQLKPMKRRGNRRYYQHHEVLLIRRIRGLLYDQGFTISGARNQLLDGGIHVPRDEGSESSALHEEAGLQDENDADGASVAAMKAAVESKGLVGIGREPLTGSEPISVDLLRLETLTIDQVRTELMSIREALLA